MYRVIVNDIMISNSTMPDTALMDASLELEASKAGSFSFTLPLHHRYANVEWGCKHDVVKVYQDGTLVFAGLPVMISKDFCGNTRIDCEGMLSVLNDTTLRGRTYSGTAASVFSAVVAQHNSQTDDNRQFSVNVNPAYTGQVSIRPDYETTMDVLTGIVESFGGYMTVSEAQGGGLQLNWDGAPNTIKRDIKVNRDLLDFTAELQAEDFFTVIIPLGKEVNGARVNITSVTQGGVDYIEDGYMVDYYGKVEKVVIYDDIDTPSVLKARAQMDLSFVDVTRFYAANAVDLGIAYSELDQLYLLDCVRINSPYAIVTLNITKMSLDLNHPESNSYEFGTAIYKPISKVTSDSQKKTSR